MNDEDTTQGHAPAVSVEAASVTDATKRNGEHKVMRPRLIPPVWSVRWHTVTLTADHCQLLKLLLCAACALNSCLQPDIYCYCL